MSSPSPQTVMPGNFLNHFPSGTSGSARIQFANSPSCAAEMFRSSTRSSKWSRSRGGRFCRRIRGILFAVKTPVDFFPQSFFFGGIVGIGHSLGKSGQCFAGQLALARQFKSKVQHTRLFSARQLFDFFNDGCGGHGLIIAQIKFQTRGNVIPNRGQFSPANQSPRQRPALFLRSAVPRQRPSFLPRPIIAVKSGVESEHLS